MVISKLGISVEYRCIYLRKPFEIRCSFEDSPTCFTCKYCKAEMSGADATKLLDSFCGEIMSRGNKINGYKPRKTIRGYHT